jgi:hypothetical protein
MNTLFQTSISRNLGLFTKLIRLTGILVCVPPLFSDRGQKKAVKLKFQNARQARTGRSMVKSNSPKEAQYLTHLSFLPYSRFPAELAPILLLAFSLFALAAALLQCLCSESLYLSIKPYLFIHVTRISRYTYIWRSIFFALHVTAEGLETYYPWTRGTPV